MYVEQIYTGCLAQGAYYIRSGKEAAIIDPLREVGPYIERAAKDEVEIKYIFETHFHADFVSGHVTLSEKTGAPIVYGPSANPKFDAIIAEDGQEFKIGDITIKVLHTPGHTLESTTYLLRNAAGEDHAIFSGDTLFLGDVGRPDLAQKGKDLTQEDLAGMLYDSLRKKIMPLGDDVMVYPAHGAGSACGKNMSKETVDTLGHQKQTNYALRVDMTKEEFIQEVTEGLAAPPAYFPMNVKMNKEGYESIDHVLKKGSHALSPKEFEVAANETGAVVLDVRKKRDFAMSHVPGSIFIGLDGAFAPWVGALIKDVQQPILLVVEEDSAEEAVIRLSRVGFDNTLGYLKGGMDAWVKAGKETDSVKSVHASELKQEITSGKYPVIDVRRPAEFSAGHVVGAINSPLDFFNDHIADFPLEKTFIIHCASGYRSLVASSILKARGYHNMIDVAGGYAAMQDCGIPVEEKVCEKTMASQS